MLAEVIKWISEWMRLGYTDGLVHGVVIGFLGALILHHYLERSRR